MFKAIIVDDEHLIRKRLRFGFDWNHLGYELVGEAANGWEAIELIERLSPDVAIVDIAMPSLNGLELAKLLRSRGNEMKLVILTGHSNFEYAREALAERIYYYLLKPINEEEFMDILQKLAIQLGEEYSERSLRKRMEEDVGNAHLVLKSKFFHDFFYSKKQEGNEEAIRKKLKEYGVNAGSRNCIVLLEIEKFILHTDENELQGKQATVENAMYGLFATRTGYVVIYNIYDGNVIIILDLEQMPGFNDRNRLPEFLENMLPYLEEYFSSAINASLGAIYRGVEGLLDSYREAELSLSNHLVFHGKKVMDYEVLRVFEGKKYIIPSGVLSELALSMQADDFLKCRGIIAGVFGDLIQEHILAKEMQTVVMHIVSEAEKLAFDSGIKISDVTGEYVDAATAIKEAKSIEDVCAWCTGIVEALLHHRKISMKKGRNVEMAQMVQKHILGCYSDPELSLEQIAGKLYMASTYVSSNFKRVFGLSVMQYITKVRLEKAKELLSLDGADIRAVTSQTGYNDEYYFSRCFKKYFGISPSNYVRSRIKDHSNN